jgi:CBS-domain-containing membrane protein
MHTTALSTLITYNPTAVPANRPLADAAAMMRQYALRHLPVVDDARRLVGIVSDYDVACCDCSEIRASPGRAVPSGAPRAVADVMSRRVVTMAHDDPPAIGLRKMLAGGFHSLPVVEGERLIGIVTSTDFLREFSYGELAVAREPAARYMAHYEAHIDVSAPLADAPRLMDNLNVEYLAVVKGLCPVGVLSRRTVRTCCGESPSATPLTAGQAATVSTPTVRPTDELAEVAARMCDAGQGAAIVVDRSHELAGLIVEDQLLALMAAALEMATGA